MSENPSITQKEKMLVSVLVKLYSKERLEEEFDFITEEGHGHSKLVFGAGKLVGILQNQLQKLSQQYLNYAVKNYDDIKEGKFPESIQRVKMVVLYGNEAENVYKVNHTRTRLIILPDTLDKCIEQVGKDLWDYDTDTIDYDYGDSDFLSFEFIPEYTDIESYENNVIN